MDARYCDVCGSIVNGAATLPSRADVGIVCETCLRTRLVQPETAGVEKRRYTRARCPHCDARLRAKLVQERVEISCPRCGGGLVLVPDGSVEPGHPPLPAGPTTRSPQSPTLGAPPSELSAGIAASAFEALAASDH